MIGEDFCQEAATRIRKELLAIGNRSVVLVTVVVAELDDVDDGGDGLDIHVASTVHPQFKARELAVEVLSTIADDYRAGRRRSV